MSKYGVEEAYKYGQEVYNKGLDLHNIDPSDFTPIEWDNVMAGYHNCGGDCQDLDDTDEPYDNGDEVDDLDFNDK